MINNFDQFATELCEYVNLDAKTIQKIYEKSRPRDVEDRSSHRRSGKTEGFRGQLNNDTIATLNEKLSKPLRIFGYKS